MADVGTGTTITFGTSAFTTALLSISGPGMSREALNTSNMATTNSHTFMPSDLVDRGEVQITIQFDPLDDPPVDQAAETITIAWPLGDTWAFSGFMTNFEPSAELEAIMTATATLKVSGDVTITDVA